MKLDCDLTRQDIQQLANADAVTALFARLGYNTEARIAQTPENLGITAEGTLKPIQHVELIADQEGLLQIYLFVLTSVTVTHTRALARAYRNRAGNYLLVLTTADYDRIDFVLIEKHVPRRAGQPSGIGQQHVAVRPRTLTVDRRKPSPEHLRVRLRVLRRFTFTEGDPFGQYDKLISAYNIADWSEEFFNNRAVFSDYFLLDRLRDMPEWREDPKPTYSVLQGLFRGASSSFGGKPEATLRDGLVEPIMAELGFVLRPGKKAGSDASTPDYYLASPAQKDSSIALCLAYPWGRSLDGKDEERDKESPEENPGAVVVSLLEKGDAPWVIVTNGKIWRLYSQRTHSRATNYYEIDLEEVLAQGGPQTSDPAEAFRYFWLFFRREAFEAPAETHEDDVKTLPFLDRLVVESEEFAKELGERLKERIFSEVFPHLAEGFIANIRAQEGRAAPMSQERLDGVFQGTLTLLYRLLFLLYAESRDLLPVKEERGYFQTSLMRLKREVAEAGEKTLDDRDGHLNKRYKKTEATLYDRLTKLFAIIDRGDSAVNVPVYNGGLFITDPSAEDDTLEAENARFLGQHKVPDRFLALALDKLARDLDPKRHDLVSIDFKSLGVRQLGSIYEGLLEFKLRIAPEKMAVVKGKKTEEVIPYAEAVAEKRKILKTGRGASAQECTYSKGAVYLENDKRERKATGSYYTPDHIVKYIVEHAVGPVLLEHFDTFRPKLRKAERERKAFFEKQEGLKKAGIRPEADSKADLVGRDLVDEVINTKVLDPAMGSGHFLVESIDFITDKTLDFLNGFRWNPVFARLEQTRQTILKEMDEQGVSIDPKRLTDVNLLKRHILKKCIYGVDFNPMAVELAKVSLWLDCFTLGAPLSFLDHHLRCGNSLIGVTVKEVRDKVEKGQALLWGTQFAGLLLATDLMRHVGDLSDVTSDQVRQSRAEYRKASDALSPFKRMLDVYTSQWFGNEVYRTGRGKKAQTINPSVEFLQSADLEAWLNAPETPDSLTQDWERNVATTALEAATTKRFFHWELEFPEVFYGPRPGSQQAIERLEGAGFDAVIGNPPYDVFGRDTDAVEAQRELEYYRSNTEYKDAIAGTRNLFKFFLCKAFQTASENGMFSLIVPMSLLGDEQTSAIRKMLLCQTSLSRIEAFPQKDNRNKRVFPEAKLSTAIFVTRKTAQDAQFRIRTHATGQIDVRSRALLVKMTDLLNFDPSNTVIPSCNQEDWEILCRIRSVNSLSMTNVGNLLEGEIHPKTHKRLLNLETNGPLVLRGASISLYALRDASQGEALHLDVKRFLNGKADSSKAFSFKMRRVGLQRKAPQNNFRRLIAAPIPPGEFCFESIKFVTEADSIVDLDLLLALLNSKLLDFYFRSFSTNAQINEYQFNVLPVPEIRTRSSEVSTASLLEKKDVSSLRMDLLSLCSEPGVMPMQVADVLSELSRRIQVIEGERELSRRSERAYLAPESQEIQDVIDAVLFRCYGLTQNEAEYVEHRLKEML